MDDKRCNNYGFIKCSSCRYAIYCKYCVHGKPFCQYDIISRFFSIYLLMVQRVGKQGVSFIYMTLLGIIFLIMGNWYLLPYYIVIGLICEAILWKHGAYQNPRRLTAAWTVSSLLFNGTNLLPIWFFWDAYYAFAVSSGMSQEYIDSYVRYFTVPYWIIFIVAFTTLCGFAGSLIASRLIKKHFEKAGVL